MSEWRVRGENERGVIRMKGICPNIFFASLAVLFAAPSFASQLEDPCKEKGMIVKNLTTRDLWYKMEGGPCYYWDENKTFVIRPGEKIGIFSDLVCKTQYCRHDPEYKDYRSVDSNGDCAAAVLPGCRLSDI